MPHVVEFRTYVLHPGAGEAFDRLVVQTAPHVERFGIDVVAFGRSLDDEDVYFLIRVFASPDERDRLERDFYGSEFWRTGPRDAVLALIASYVDVVLELDDATIAGLRRSAQGASTQGP
jgi:hypothetical protein